ncbi:MAG TPA: hypothetical protein PK593_07040 [Thermomicrobiales bacterium]|jgi:hypothetical protein|nr:hypothetical protein [Chloroflexota bacterium]HCG28671.1 hypothetical protein [Chloroflexota bacterium]HQX63200.1 hypothetical protein [Thermomicrobiales bacterium]HQZ90434.1 hypothetical protein [Thermomicrobiales bacterium]HRA31002.1 hypothetical protein [Thermomicrobiales bacterium]
MAARGKGVGVLTRRDFFGDLADAARRQLPVERQEFETRQTMNLLKVHYGANYRIHYEIWINAEKQQIEVGLHFEDGPASTARLLTHFDAAILEIKHELGAQVELERWTLSWGHLFELHEVEPLTPLFAEQLAGRLVRFIDVLQPMLEEGYELGLAPRTPHPSTFHERFRGRGRRG